MASAEMHPVEDGSESSSIRRQGCETTETRTVLVSAGARVNRMCWKSSKASITSSPHLVQRVGETRRLFDLAGADEPMFLTYT